MKEKQYPKIVVGVLICNEKDEIFLGECHKWKNKWTVPGGHLEWGESLEDCVRREVKEETNLDISNIELVEVQEGIFPEEFHKKKHMIFLDYCCKADSKNVILNNELNDYTWTAPDKALLLNLGTPTKRFIEKFIEFRS